MRAKLGQDYGAAIPGGMNTQFSTGNSYSFNNVNNREQLEKFKQKAMVNSDSDMAVWELVTDMPYVHKAISVLVAIINIFVPGFGTLVMAYFYEESFSKTQMVIGCSQFFLSAIIVGWIWAQYWSFLLIVKSFKGAN